MPRQEWPSSPAKMIAVLMLGGASVAGIGYSVLRESTPAVGGAATGQPARPSASRAGVVDRSEGVRERPPAEAPGPTPTVALKININTANKPELELLPGIGPSLAERIIAERERGGAFARVEDLSRVRGIGGKTIERLREHVTCDVPVPEADTPGPTPPK